MIMYFATMFNHPLKTIANTLNNLPLVLFACSLIFASLLSVSSNSNASGFFDKSNNSSSNTDNNLKDQLGLSTQVAFLPVEEAYQLSITTTSTALLLNWHIQPNYYLYKNQFKFDANGQTLSPIFNTHGIVKYDDYFEKELELYHDLVEINLPLSADLPQQQFTLKATSQGCADAGLCYPPQTEYFQINLSAGTATTTSTPTHPLTSAILTTVSTGTQAPDNDEIENSDTEKSTTALWLILLLAAAGGSLLNLMPCVFPVLSIKVLSLAKSGGNHLEAHGWVYTAGVVLTFVAIAALMLVARSAGSAVGWGFQLQSPLLVTLLAYLFFAMGLSLSGLASFGSRLMGIGQNLTNTRGLRGSFFTGALATLVASPCTAPFMATALGFALTQPPITALLIFAALGFGMALPFLLLCHSPKLAQKLPKPGAWMDTLKQALAFPLYLSAIWLLWVLGRQAGSDAVALASLGLLLIAFALWLTHLPEQTRLGTRLRLIAALLALLGALALSNSADDKTTPTQDIWKAYSAENLQRWRAQGQPVFINLTADWCLTCLANEKLTLDTHELETLFENYGVIAAKGDWTNYNAEITQLLEQYQRSGVPLYLLFPSNGERAQVLPQLLRYKHIEAALARTEQAISHDTSDTIQ